MVAGTAVPVADGQPRAFPKHPQAKEGACQSDIRTKVKLVFPTCSPSSCKASPTGQKVEACAHSQHVPHGSCHVDVLVLGVG